MVSYFSTVDYIQTGVSVLCKKRTILKTASFSYVVPDKLLIELYYFFCVLLVPIKQKLWDPVKL